MSITAPRPAPRALLTTCCGSRRRLRMSVAWIATGWRTTTPRPPLVRRDPDASVLGGMDPAAVGVQLALVGAHALRDGLLVGIALRARTRDVPLASVRDPRFEVVGRGGVERAGNIGRAAGLDDR